METVIITGASGGLGTTVTRHFLDKGYRVAATVSNESGRSFLSHPNLETFVVDLADERAAALFVESVAGRYEQIDAAVLLAGGFAPGSIADTDGNLIQQQLSVNFFTAYFVVRPLVDQMQRHGGGRIVLTGARPATKPSYGKGLVAYSLSKSLLFRLAEIINQDTRHSGVSAAVVSPSTIDTSANRRAMPDADPNNWVSAENLAEIIGWAVSASAASLRETVLNVYGNA